VADRWATFDCYGTLIDWMSGISGALATVWPAGDSTSLLARYHQIEPQVQAGRGIPYRQVMTETLERLAAAEGLEIPPRRTEAVGESLPSWPPFAETHWTLDELRSRGWRLAVLSNTDPDLLDASIRAIGVPIDERVVASEIGAYKPALDHWEEFFRRTKADRALHVHVAASLFHDIEPCAKLGLPAVWINREHETSDLPRAGELPDLTDLPDMLDRLVPAVPPR
jgi:2-haloacid dehalogenase